jgi:hypothetical protein
MAIAGSFFMRCAAGKPTTACADFSDEEREN